ncbi:MAG: hypothetical protein HRU80_03425 [Ignavibacteriales bacterium]|nr:MAG: hypothetical protein HRU80_03425 [Ignavibacteriales bacterium]
MVGNVFKNISTIIERDSKTTTYKYALLRGTIDIINENSPFISHSNGRVSFPLGLLIEKWILYYYPILESETELPQINGNVNLAFGEMLKTIILAYKHQNGFSGFYNDLRNNGIPKEIQKDFIKLVVMLKTTIVKNPMRYIGRSVSDHYFSIYKYSKDKKGKAASKIDIDYLITTSGSVSIPEEYYDAFRIIGTFIGGQDSILFKWAEFSVNASGKSLSVEKVIHETLRSPVSERDVVESKKFYESVLRSKGTVYCVWTGKRIPSYDIDHCIPFSVWRNNDLWNLLPSNPKTNKIKRDKIPAPDLVEKQKDLIIHYWQLLENKLGERFRKEIRLALLGDLSSDNWELMGINQLKIICHELISNRGYEEWNP